MQFPTTSCMICATTATSTVGIVYDVHGAPCSHPELGHPIWNGPPIKENDFDPLESDLADPRFEVIWQAIKEWDIKTPYDSGYHSPTGNNVMMILRPLRKLSV